MPTENNVTEQDITASLGFLISKKTGLPKLQLPIFEKETANYRLEIDSDITKVTIIEAKHRMMKLSNAKLDLKIPYKPSIDIPIRDFSQLKALLFILDAFEEQEDLSESVPTQEINNYINEKMEKKKILNKQNPNVD